MRAKMTDLSFADITLLIVAGGESSRMGIDKRWLKVGDMGLLEHTLAKAKAENFGEIILCVEEDLPELNALADQYEALLCLDQETGLGPMAGLAAGLSRMTKDWALAVSGDMPFFDYAAVRSLRTRCQPEVQVVLPIARGRRQPLAAFYHKSLAERFAQALKQGQRSLYSLMEQVSHVEIEIETPGEIFFNVNAPADLRLARGRMKNLERKVPVISVVAPASGTGKTTFIEKLLPKLQTCGLRVGVVKSDSHGFQLDLEGKDSWRFANAGAKSVAVVSPKGWVLIQETDERATLEQVAAKMENIDLLLSESRTHGTGPALSLWRGMGDPMTGDDVAAVFAKGLAPDHVQGVLQFDLDDVEEAVRLCLFLMGR